MAAWALTFGMAEYRRVAPGCAESVGMHLRTACPMRSNQGTPERERRSMEGRRSLVGLSLGVLLQEVARYP